MNNNFLGWGLFALGLGLAGYALLSGDGNSQSNYVTVPRGGNYGGYTNNTDAEVYITAAGQIITATGQIIGIIENLANNSNSGGGGGQASQTTDTMSPYYSPGGAPQVTGRWSTGYM